MILVAYGSCVFSFSLINKRGIKRKLMLNCKRWNYDECFDIRFEVVEPLPPSEVISGATEFSSGDTLICVGIELRNKVGFL